MSDKNVNQWLNTEIGFDDYLLTWLDAFLVDRKAQNLAAGTLDFYRAKFRLFMKFCDAQSITRISQITPGIIREYLLWIAQTHNPGGQHQCYRSLKTFLLWWELETEPEGWRNPIRKVKAPRMGIEPLEPVDLKDVSSILSTCDKTLFGIRDTAIILVLLDTGARAAELCSMDLSDFNPVTGEILIRRGKGHKPRTVFLGQKSRRAVRKYLKIRRDNDPSLWVAKRGERLTYWGLHEIIRRRAKLAGIENPGIHAFRRAFAINMLRNGVDIYSLQKLMGHADLQVLRRYLAQTNDDLKEAHAKGSPVDKFL